MLVPVTLPHALTLLIAWHIHQIDTTILIQKRKFVFLTLLHETVNTISRSLTSLYSCQFRAVLPPTSHEVVWTWTQRFSCCAWVKTVWKKVRVRSLLSSGRIRSFREDSHWKQIEDSCFCGRIRLFAGGFSLKANWRIRGFARGGFEDSSRAWKCRTTLDARRIQIM